MVVLVTDAYLLLLLYITFSRLKAEQKDAATHLVLSAHLQLQNEGFLSTWTNSFVGPWDPSQGAHNPGGCLTIVSLFMYTSWIAF